MKKDKEYVVKVIGDVVYIGIMVGAIIVEWRILGKINKSALGKAEMLIFDMTVGSVWTNHLVEAGKTAWKLIKDFRQKNVESYNSKVEEILKSHGVNGNEEVIIDMGEIFRMMKVMNICPEAETAI